MPSFLKDKKYQDTLASVFNEYHADLEEILELATIESNGIRPRHIENEIYALFHHISRSLCDIQEKELAIKEVEHAKNTHLKRAILDSYKIAINNVLKRANKNTEILEEIATDPDYREAINESIVNLNILTGKKNEIKKKYLEAKKTERKGNTAGAILLYNGTIELLNELEYIITDIEKNNTFKLALKHIEKIEKNKKKQNKFSILLVIFTVLLTAIINLFISYIGGSKLLKNTTAKNSVVIEE
jgi:hypothetical protein